MVFTTLAHMMDEEFLTEAFNQLRKDAAAGIDEVTATEYKVNLRERIKDLQRRMVFGQYRAQPARRHRRRHWQGHAFSAWLTECRRC